MLEIKDLAGLSQPITKLIEVIANGCNWITQPYQIKRIANANAYASSVQSKEDFKQGLRNSLLEYTQRSMLSVRENRQIENLANIINYAGQELQAIDKINEAPVSPEWSSRFFDYAQNICDEEIQIIWGKILAQETATPGKFFKRTLSILHNIEPIEAKCFTELCQFILDGTFVHFDTIHPKYFELNKLQSMMDCGLVNAQKCEMTYDLDVDTFYFKSHYLKKRSKSILIKISFPGFSLTDAGNQLYNITQVSSNIEFVKKVKEEIKNTYGIDFEIKECNTQEHQ